MLEEKNGKGCHLEQRGDNSPPCVGTDGNGYGSTAFLSKPKATSAFHVEGDRLHVVLKGMEK